MNGRLFEEGRMRRRMEYEEMARMVGGERTMVVEAKKEEKRRVEIEMCKERYRESIEKGKRQKKEGR